MTDDTVTPEKRPQAARSWAALVAASSSDLRSIFHDSPDGCGGFAHPSWRPSRGYKCDRLAALAAAASSPESGLDVERLDEAWANVMDGRRIGRGLDAARIGRDTTTPEDWWHIAAEYARLASEENERA